MRSFKVRSRRLVAPSWISGPGSWMTRTATPSPASPDIEGKVTRLRTSGGVNLTEAGARKAAHFAQVELKRLIAARAEAGTASPQPGPPATEAATPAEGVASASVPGDPPKPKPVEGPVLPLTNPPLKAPGATLATGSIRLDGDPVVNRALRDGIAPPPRPGRADEVQMAASTEGCRESEVLSSAFDQTSRSCRSTVPLAVSHVD